jgi:hypothetical protein
MVIVVSPQTFDGFDTTSLVGHGDIERVARFHMERRRFLAVRGLEAKQRAADAVVGGEIIECDIERAIVAEQVRRRCNEAAGGRARACVVVVIGKGAHRRECQYRQGEQQFQNGPLHWSPPLGSCLQPTSGPQTPWSADTPGFAGSQILFDRPINSIAIFYGDQRFI